MILNYGNVKYFPDFKVANVPENVDNTGKTT